MSQKYQREIEEILRQARELRPKKRDRGPKRGLLKSLGAYLGASLGGKRWAITPGRIGLIAVAILLSALILQAMVPGVVAPLFWAALLLFIVAYAFFLARPSSDEKRWRGQPISYDRTTLQDRFRKWLGR